MLEEAPDLEVAFDDNGPASVNPLPAALPYKLFGFASGHGWRAVAALNGEADLSLISPSHGNWASFHQIAVQLPRGSGIGVAFSTSVEIEPNAPWGREHHSRGGPCPDAIEKSQFIRRFKLNLIGPDSAGYSLEYRADMSYFNQRHTIEGFPWVAAGQWCGHSYDEANGTAKWIARIQIRVRS